MLSKAAEDAVASGKMTRDAQHSRYGPTPNQLTHLKRVARRRKQMHENDVISTYLYLAKEATAGRVRFHLRAPFPIVADNDTREVLSNNIGPLLVYFEVRLDLNFIAC